MMKCADILQILCDTLGRRLLEQPVIYAHETTLKVVSDNKSKSYMWLYAKGADSPEGKLAGTDIPNIVLYDYKAGRAGQVAIDYLGGYAGYHKTQATLVGCWPHTGRYFTDAQKAIGKHKSGKIEWALKPYSKAVSCINVNQRQNTRWALSHKARKELAFTYRV
jgi:transposase